MLLYFFATFIKVLNVSTFERRLAMKETAFNHFEGTREIHE
jgi:hypothetical protein